MNVSEQSEWRRYWALPVVSMLGISGSMLVPSLNGLLLVPLTQEFGWTRSQFSTAYLFQVMLGLVTTPLAGRVIDRYGPRRVILCGLPIAAAGISSLSLVTEQIWTWYLLMIVQGLAIAFVIPLGWMSVVILRFEASRGTALAIALSGVGLGAAVWPLLGAYLITWLGWRTTFLVAGLGWALLLLLLSSIVLPRDRTMTRSERSSQLGEGGIWPLLCSPTVLLLISSGCLFIGVVHGLTMHMIALLEAVGYERTDAAKVSALAGVFAIVGRLATGALLDRLPAKPIAVVVFMLPIIVCCMLLSARMPGAVPVFSIILLGFSLGAETDVIAYVASRKFDPRLFGSIYGVISASFAFSAGAGPLVVSLLYDSSGSYSLFLVVAGPVLLIGAGLISRISMRG